MNYHIPVLINKILENINFDDIKGVFFLLDACLGEGGYSKIILEKFPTIKIIGIEQDYDIFLKAKENLKNFGERIIIFNENFVNIEKIFNIVGINFISYAIFDLGISMYHIKESNKGITFMKDQPLDMRLSKNCEYSAFDVINNFPLDKLEKIFKDFGEERFSKKIAIAIVEERKKRKIKTTFELRDVVIKVIGRKTRIDPATRVFQALRIFVNNELENLKKVLSYIPQRTILNGRIFIVSYHSLEDRVVKHNFIEFEKMGVIKKVYKKPIVPDYEEIKMNPSSRSAKLRIYEKIVMEKGIFYENS